MSIENVAFSQTCASLKTFNYKSIDYRLFDLLIDFIGISTRLGLFYAKTLGNCVYCTFILTFFRVVVSEESLPSLVPVLEYDTRFVKCERHEGIKPLVRWCKNCLVSEFKPVKLRLKKQQHWPCHILPERRGWVKKKKKKKNCLVSVGIPHFRVPEASS